MAKPPLADKAVYLTTDLPADVLTRLESIVDDFGGYTITEPLESHYVITNPPYESTELYRIYRAHVDTLEPDEPRPMLRPYHWLFASHIAGKLLKAKDVPPLPIFQCLEQDAGDEQTIHRPLRVYVSVNIVKADDEVEALDAQRNVINLIEANGGIRSDKRGTADVLVLNLETNAGKQYASEKKDFQKVVERGWVERKLGLTQTGEEETQQEEDELDSFGEDAPVGYKRKPSRQEFTQKDDEYLARFLAFEDPHQSKWMSRFFYERKLLADLTYSSWAERHTAQSWKERVKKHTARFRLRVDALRKQGLDATLRTEEERKRKGRMKDGGGDDDGGRPAKKLRTDDADEEEAAARVAQYARRQQAEKQVTQVRIASQHARRLAQQSAHADEDAEQFGGGSDEEMDTARETENAVRKPAVEAAVRREAVGATHAEQAARNGMQEAQPRAGPSTNVPAHPRTPSVPPQSTLVGSSTSRPHAGTAQASPLGRRIPSVAEPQPSAAPVTEQRELAPPTLASGHRRTPSISSREESAGVQPQAGPSTLMSAPRRAPSITIREASTERGQVTLTVELDSEDERTEADMRRSMRARSQRLAETADVGRDNAAEEQQRRPLFTEEAIRPTKDEMSAEAVVRQLYGAFGFVPHGVSRSVGASGQRPPRASEPPRGLARVDEERSTMLQRAKERRSMGGFAPAMALLGTETQDEEEDELSDPRSVPVTVTGRLQIDSIQLSPRATGPASTPNLTQSSPLGRRQPLFAPRSSLSPSAPSFRPSGGPSRPTAPSRHATDYSLAVEARSDTSEAALPPLDPTAELDADRERKAQRGQQTLKKVAQMAQQWGMDPKEMLAIVTQHQRQNGGRIKHSELVELLKRAKAAKLISSQAGGRSRG